MVAEAVELNYVKWIFVFWVLTKSLMTVNLKYINVRFSTHPNTLIPTELKDVITPESYEKSKHYLADNTRLGMVQELFHAGITLVLVLLFAPWLETIAMAWTDGYWMQGLLFFAVLFLVDYILSLPFKIYDIFGILPKKTLIYNIISRKDSEKKTGRILCDIFESIYLK